MVRSPFSMFSLVLSLLIAVLAACGGSGQSGTDQKQVSKTLSEASDGLLIKFDQSMSQDWDSRKRILDAVDLKEAGNLGSLAPGWFRVVQNNTSQNLQQLINTVRGASGVLAVEANYFVQTHNTIPNDSEFTRQYALHNTGQVGLEGVDIDAPQAWDIQTGSPVLVAILDTGIDYNHPDLKNNIWLNKDEIADNNIDDDGNGYIDDVRGWNFVSGVNTPGDDNGHGTHVAGVIGAQTNNKEGIAGVNWHARLMPLKFMDKNGVGTIYSAVQALSYAVDNGAMVSNLSWGTRYYSKALFEAIESASQRGHLVVVSAGNDGLDIDDNPVYPAAYDLNNIITVTAVNERAQLATFANYSRSGKVHIAAPGVNIFSTYIRDVQQQDNPVGYAVLSGSSAAAAYVTGAISLVLSQQDQPDPWQLKQAMFSSASTNGIFDGKVAAEGMLNVFGLLNLYLDTGSIITDSPETGDTKQNLLDSAADLLNLGDSGGGQTGVASDVITDVPVLSTDKLSIGINDQFEIVVQGGAAPFEWISSDETVATVDNSGMLSTYTPGETQVYVVDANGAESNILSVLVSDLHLQSVLPATMSVGESISVKVVGGEGPFAWKITGNVLAAELNVDTSDSTIATITAKQPGSFQIDLIDSASTSVLSLTSTQVKVIAADIAIDIPSTTSMIVGETLALTAASSNGGISWQSDDDAIASVDSTTGIVTAHSKGSVTITAIDAFGQNDSIVIKVNLLPIQIAIPTTDTLWVGDGNTLQLTATGGLAPYSWTSSAPTFATVDNSGLVSPVDFSPQTLAEASQLVELQVSDADGNTATIMLNINKLFIEAPVSALTIGATTTINVFSDNNSFSWAVTGTGSASFDSATRSLIAEKSGTVVITATDAKGSSASTQSISINTLPLVITEPSSRELWLGNATGNSITLQAVDGQGPYVWTTEQADIVSVDSISGAVSGLKPGNALVRVTDDLGNSNAIMLTVKQITLTTPAAYIEAYDSLQLSGSGYGLLTWSIDNEAIASISQTGLLKTTGAGVVMVTVSDELFNSVSLSISVSALSPLVVVSPSTDLWLGKGSTTQLDISGGKAPYTLSSQDASIATVDSTGFVIARSVGSTIVSVVDSIGNSQTLALSVNKISLTAATTSIHAYDSLQLNGAGSGNLVWSVDSSNAGLDQNGLFNSTVPGTYVVTITDQLLNSASIAISVTALDALMISTSDSTALWLGNGNTAQLLSSGGKAPYSWSSDNPAVVSVNSNGLATAQGIGFTNIRLKDSIGGEKTIGLSVQKIAISSTVTASDPGDSIQLNATGAGSLTWSVNSIDATISQSGLFTSIVPGTYNVTVSDGLQNSASITLTVNTLASLNITNSGSNILWLGNGSTTQLNVSGGKAPYTWSSDDSTVAIVDVNGLVTAQNIGSTIIRVTDALGSVKTIALSINDMSLTVSNSTISVGDNLQFSAIGAGSISWSVSNNTASISQNGLLTALAAGSVTVSATDANGNTRSQVVTINALDPLLITSTTTQLWIGNGNTVQLSAGGGKAPYVWSSVDTNIVTVDTNGFVIAQAVGTTTIKVTDSLANVSTISLSVSQIQLTAALTSIDVGDQLQFTASGAGVLTWSVNNTNASIGQNGLLSAIAAGSAIVSVTDELGNSASKSIVINALQTLVLSATKSQLWLGNGNTAQLSVSGGKASYIFSSDNPAIAAVNSSGLVTAQAPGSTTLRVTDSLGTVASLTMSVDQIGVSAPLSIINVGDQLQFSGNGSGILSWSVSNANASINQSGLLTANSAGTVVVTLTDALANTASQTVTINALAPLNINSTTTELWFGNGNTTQLNAGGGKTPYTWGSDNTAIASVNSSGLVTAQGVGSTTVRVTDALGTQQTISITVKQINLSAPQTTIVQGDTLQLSANAFGNVNWSVNNANATITQTGLLTALVSGSITVVITDDLNNSTSLNITISALPALIVSAQSTTQLWLGNANQVQLSATGGKSPYSWSVATGSAVVSVSASGLVTAQSTGVATVQVTDSFNNVDTIQINVDKVSLTAASSSVEEGSSVQLYANGSGNLTWSVSGSGTGSVNTTTKVFNASTPGSVTITMTDANGNAASVNINITAIPNLVINKNVNTTLWLGNGNTVQLNATGGSGSYTWQVVSGSSVVTVNSNGFVTAQNTGTATVKVSDQSGRSDSISFTVKQVSISGSSSYTVNVGDTISFSGVGYGSLTWFVSSTSLASISSSGTFSALAAGTVTVTMRDSNNNYAINSVSVTINSPFGGGGGGMH